MSLKTLLGAGLCAAMLAPLGVSSAQAQADNANIGDIITVAFTYCPRGWYNAAGSIVSIVDNQALFSLIGTTYGGDGRTTMGLPDFRGRAIVHTGQAPGHSFYPLGQMGGFEERALTLANLPAHSHAVQGSSSANNVPSPANASFPDFSAAPLSGYNAPADTPMESDIVSQTGGQSFFSVIAPSTGIRFCINYDGIYPQRP